jgi:nucleotide-binding universal stress UspA family protein
MFTTIIWATDSSEHASRALPYAVALAERDQAPLHVVHVVEKMTGGHIAGQFTYADEEERKAKLEAQVAAIRAEHAVDVELHMVPGGTGQVAHRIAQVAEEIGADLIVVGTHGRTGLGTALIGSVTQRLLRDASCPVLAVPRMKVPETPAGSESATTTA